MNEFYKQEFNGLAQFLGAVFALALCLALLIKGCGGMAERARMCAEACGTLDITMRSGVCMCISSKPDIYK